MERCLTIQELISLKTDLFNSSKVKLVRHKDSRLEYRDVIKDRDKLIEYQKEQAKDIFKGVDYIISFIGLENSKALLFGFFKVNGVKKVKKDKYVYELDEIKEEWCNTFNDRVVIDWGKGALMWHQWYDISKNKSKEVIEILPKGYLGEFKGLTNFIIDFQELEKIIKNPDANRDWKTHLSSVNGIYMILDKKTGNQYIGSAYGKNGIWQRWSTYVKNKHGENKKLIELCNSSNNYHKNFQYTVLQSLPSNLSAEEVIKIENLYKEKFGSKAHGLNEN